MKDNKNNKVLKWFKKEGAVRQEGNLYIATRAFIANSVVSWIREQGPSLKQNQIEYIMKKVRLFLLNEIDLKWDNGKVEILSAIQNISKNEQKVEAQTKGIK